MHTILVTGGAGFIGSHLVQSLVDEGYSVRIIDNLSSGEYNNISLLRDKVELFQGDIRDEKLLEIVLDGVDTVFHLAAMVSVPETVADPVLCHEINTNGSFLLLEKARVAGVQRVVLASSAAVYGDEGILPKKEGMSLRPLSPYATSKASMELYASMYYHAYGLETVCLRFFNAFGPKQDPNSPYAAAIAKFTSLMKQGVSPIVHGDGGQTRDFIFISDIVQAYVKAANKPGIGGEIFNIAYGKSYSLLEIIEAINNILGTDLAPIYGPLRPGDVRHSSADISKAKERLDFTPEFSLAEGLRKLLMTS